LQQNHKTNKGKNLQTHQTRAYKPAYKGNPKQREIDTSKLSADLAEIVRIWPDLPPAIRSAIVAIVRASSDR
jgi:hypothetical protein